MGEGGGGEGWGGKVGEGEGGVSVCHWEGVGHACTTVWGTGQGVVGGGRNVRQKPAWECQTWGAAGQPITWVVKLSGNCGVGTMPHGEGRWGGNLPAIIYHRLRSPAIQLCQDHRCGCSSHLSAGGEHAVLIGD